MVSDRLLSCCSLLVCMMALVLSCPVSPAAASLSLSVKGGGALSTFTESQTVMLTAVLRDDAGRDVSLDGERVRWSAVDSHVRSKAWARPADRWNGLCWGRNALSLSGPEEDSLRMAGTPPVGATAFLTDIAGERDVTVQASVTLKKTGATDGGKPIRAVCGLCEKQFGFLSGFIMTFVTAFPIMFLSIYYSFSDR